MAYRIEYLRKGVKVGTALFLGSLDGAIKAATDGLLQQKSDAARVLDMNDNGKEVRMVMHR
jgi:hypothetical protein